jgi:hypothetical protein
LPVKAYEIEKRLVIEYPNKYIQRLVGSTEHSRCSSLTSKPEHSPYSLEGIRRKSKDLSREEQFSSEIEIYEEVNAVLRERSAT